ncbi:hypothetical protein DMC47_08385 [Nostoc sp. 3335mG]|nr:hypothetical protein DMC47_08385 [Nostoc sp. 3335mG]
MVDIGSTRRRLLQLLSSVPVLSLTSADRLGSRRSPADAGQANTGEVSQRSETILQVGRGAVVRTVQDKLRETVTVKDFGAIGDGLADDTRAIQAAMDAHDHVRIPSGTYKVSMLRFKRNNQVIEGDGWSNTVLQSTASVAGASVIANNDPAVTLLGCEMRDLHVSATKLARGSVVDWAHMQHGLLQRLFVAGGGANCVGITLAATWTVTECTYNTIIGCYVGGVKFGFRLSDGANNNVFINCRVQPSSAGGFGFLLKTTAATASISAVTMLGCSIEYPGNITGGIYVGERVSSLTVIGCRFEQLLSAIVINPGAINTTLLGNYYDGNTNQVTDSSSTTVRAEQGGLHGNDVLERLVVFNGTTGVAAKAQGATCRRNGVGDYTINFTKAMTNPYPVVSVSFTKAARYRISAVTEGYVHVLLFDDAGVATDGNYISVIAKEIL